MKASEVRKCSLCGKGVMHAGGVPFFWTVKVERYCIDMRAVQQRASMEMFFGGGSPGAAMAEAMGPNPDIAKPFGDPIELIVCEPCGINQRLPIAALAEDHSDKSGEEE